MSREPYDPEWRRNNELQRIADACERIANASDKLVESFQPIIFAAGQLTGMLYRIKALYPEQFHGTGTAAGPSEDANQNPEGDA